MTSAVTVQTGVRLPSQKLVAMVIIVRSSKKGVVARGPGLQIYARGSWLVVSRAEGVTMSPFSGCRTLGTKIKEVLSLRR